MANQTRSRVDESLSFIGKDPLDLLTDIKSKSSTLDRIKSMSSSRQHIKSHDSTKRLEHLNEAGYSKSKFKNSRANKRRETSRQSGILNVPHDYDEDEEEKELQPTVNAPLFDI